MGSFGKNLDQFVDLRCDVDTNGGGNSQRSIDHERVDVARGAPALRVDAVGTSGAGLVEIVASGQQCTYIHHLDAGMVVNGHGDPRFERVTGSRGSSHMGEARNEIIVSAWGVAHPRRVVQSASHESSESRLTAKPSFERRRDRRANHAHVVRSSNRCRIWRVPVWQSIEAT